MPIDMSLVGKPVIPPTRKNTTLKIDYNCHYCGAQAYQVNKRVRIFHTTDCELWIWLRNRHPALVKRIWEIPEESAS